MTKNPLANGLMATVYIVLISFIMNFGTRVMAKPNAFLAPIAVISLFTLSAAIMGYIFCYEPAQLYLSGKKKQGVNLFLKTTAIFGGITLLILLLMFSGIFS